VTIVTAARALKRSGETYGAIVIMPAVLVTF
jgi:hypothetical protein